MALGAFLGAGTALATEDPPGTSAQAPSRALADAPDYAGADVFKMPELARTVSATLRKEGRLSAPELAFALGVPPLDQLAASPPRPGLVREQDAPVTPDNSSWDPGTNRVRVAFTFPPVLGTHRFAENPDPKGPLARLQRLVARGLAAGNVGDLYDNRDDGHSRLRKGQRTQLSHVTYGPEARAAGLHYGLNTGLLFNRPTFGNSSTALSGQFWRSQPRHALTSNGGAWHLWQLYASNHVYVFPEHRDHDPVADKGKGDLFPANTPYMLISQGSSGSDQPLLQAVQAILAAFPPKVKARLIEENLVAPMIQQVLRRGLRGVPDYLDPLAHPVVIRAEDIDLAAMIRHAQALRPDRIPPMVTLHVVRETPPDASVFADGLNEILFDTPGAVARVWRGARGQRQYELIATAEDPSGHALDYHWRVIRGDVERISIEPLDLAGRRVRVTLPWHDPMPVPGRHDITAPRVDIAVIADNGAELSAPAFFSMLYPAHQDRMHDAAGRIVEIDHTAGNGTYADPRLWPSRNWRDQFLHDGEGQMTGWTRQRANGKTASFTAHGLEILERDGEGRASLAARVTYPLSPGHGGGLLVSEERMKDRFRYTYTGPSDRIGRPVPITR